MKDSKISLLSLCALFSAFAVPAKADTPVQVDPSSSWMGYMNVFELPANGGAYLWGSPWGVEDLRANFSGTVLTLSPNTIGDPNEYWYIGGGAPGNPGNKIMAASMYVEPPAGTLANQTVTFSGEVLENTLTSAHTVVAFIKDFAPDYSSFNVVSVPLEPGPFSITLTTEGNPGRHVQYGFEMVGVNVWETDVEPFGEVKVAVAAPSPNVTVSPLAPWQGFLNIYQLPPPDGDGEFVRGEPWPLADLTASFSGPVLTLGPNSIQTELGPDDPEFYDEYWNGVKSMEAVTYVETPPGALSGQTVTFRGHVLSNTLTEAHTAVAFIKDFAPDYSSFNEVRVPLDEGDFSISLETLPDPERHIQYGFEVVGVNVWITDAYLFGEVLIVSSAQEDPFADWIAGFDFSGFSDPDLTAGGDPDGDGTNNLMEFALDGNPAGGADGGKVRAEIGEVDGEKALLLTLPVRGSPLFDGFPEKAAMVEGLTYVIEGSNGLEEFNQEVLEVVPARTEGLPDLSGGWNYRTFRLKGAVDGPGSRGPKGFLRVRVPEAP